jgi:hypothetical protein
VPKYFQSKASGIVIDDSSTGTGHAWSPNRIIQEITSKVTSGTSAMGLKALTDVNVTSSPTNGYVLTYNSVSGKWEAKSVATKLADLTDVTLSGITDKQFIRYDSVAKKFKNITLKMEDISNFEKSSGTANGYIVRWDSATNKYKTAPPPKLTELSDVNATSIVNNSVLQYSLSEGKFKAVQMFRIQDLRDVDVSNGLGEGKVLVWDSTKNAFVLKILDAKTKLTELTDVNTTSLEDGSVPKYSDTEKKFITGKLNLGELGDIDLADLQDGFTIKWDATKGKFVATQFLGGAGEGGTVNYITRHEYEYITNNITDNSTNINSTKQVTKLGVVADVDNPREIDIVIPFTDDFNFGKIEVLKYGEGSHVISNISHFDNTDNGDFVYDPDTVIFDGKMGLKTTFSKTQDTFTDLGEDGKIFSIPLDISSWKKINEIVVS